MGEVPELVEVVGVFLELAQLLDLVIDMLRPFVGIEAGIVIFVAVFLEPLPVAVEHVLDILHKEEFAESSHLTTCEK